MMKLVYWVNPVESMVHAPICTDSRCSRSEPRTPLNISCTLILPPELASTYSLKAVAPAKSLHCSEPVFPMVMV